MMEENAGLLSLCAYLVLASLMAIGGGVIMLAPDIHFHVVDLHHLISDAQFAAAFTLAQAAPGPNFLFVTMIGWQIGGLFGALLSTVAVVGPSTILTLIVLRLQRHQSDTRLARAFRTSMAALSVGLLGSAAWVLASASGVTWHGSALVIATIALSLRTKMNPVILIAGGALAGLLGFI